MRMDEAEPRLRELGIGRWHYSIGAAVEGKFCAVGAGDAWELFFLANGRKEELYRPTSEEDAARFFVQRFETQRAHYVRMGMDLRKLARDE